MSVFWDMASGSVAEMTVILMMEAVSTSETG
jgi:hypothetical protein